MALNTGNILILKSDTMNDTDAGGGRITNQVVVGGESNNVFDDVSPLDRTTGALNLRKVFTSVSIDTVDKYFGAHTIISKIPSDTQVNVSLFNSKDWFDRRTDASDDIASYYGKGSDYPGFLYGTGWEGSKAINIFQSETAAMPLVGDVLILTQGNDSQYVRISSIESSVQQFTVGTSDFTRKIVELTLSDALRYDFVGSKISKDDSITPATLINKTIVADSAKYYSARPLDSTAVIGQSTIKADTLFTQLVPNTLIETAKVDQNPSGNTIATYAASGSDLTYTTSTQISSGVSFDIGGSVTPGTLEIVTSAGTITDDGGVLLGSGVIIGSMNYNTGIATFSSASPTYTGSKVVSFTPAAPIVRVKASKSTEITAANRGQVWTQSFFQALGRGSVTVNFRVLGVWYTLYDDADGTLYGDSTSVGSGSVNYASGSINVSLGELPDVGSEIIYTWGTVVGASQVSTTPPPLVGSPVFTNTVANGFSVSFIIPDTTINLSTLVITWGSNSASCSSSGVLSGAATGTVQKVAGSYAVMLSPTTVPAVNTVFNANYGTLSPTTKTANYVTGKNANGTITIVMDDVPIKEGSVDIEWSISTYDHQSSFTSKFIKGVTTVHRLLDDGNGGLIDSYGRAISGATVDYLTGTINFTPSCVIKYPVVTTTNDVLSVAYVEKTVKPEDNLKTITVRCAHADPLSTGTTSYVADSIQFIGNGDGRNSNIVSGSVQFTWASSHYYTSGYQVLKNGVIVGAVNPENSVVSLTSWGTNTSNTSVVLNSMLNIENPVLPSTGTRQSSDTGVTSFVFKIDGGAIKSESLQMSVPYYIATTGTVEYTAWGNQSYGVQTETLSVSNVTFSEETVIVTADANGTLIGTEVNGTGDSNITGTINYETGVVKFDIKNATTGQSVFIDPSQIVYSVSNKKFTPIDSDLLGIDHVRLPENGRVPAFAVGDVVVIHNTRKTTVSPSASTTTDLLQTDLSKVTATDSGGATLQNTHYSVDLDLGVITWTDLVGVILPITVTYTIEDMTTLTDVQIDGTLGLAIPISHDYPLADTMISNALIHGDMFANVSDPFDQSTFTGVWSDSIIGSPTLGELNNSQYPITVTNQDCIEERWLIQFASSSLINVIGEHVGQVLTGVSITNTANTIAPVNPSTNQPYFTISNLAFGGGWSAGNAIRFNTHAANAPVWIIQSVNQGAATDTSDDALEFCLEFRGARNTI